MQLSKLRFSSSLDRLTGGLTLVLVLTTGSLHADVKMPAIFGDHMVLQQEAKLPVWGTADAGEKVSVVVGASKGSAVTGSDGKWKVDLTPLPAGTVPLTMTVTGKNKLTFTDVLVGDVWIASGQSNMEFSMGGAHNAATELPNANDPQLRLFLVAHKNSFDPVDDVVGKWEVCTPESAKGFSAAAYFFGRDLRTTLNRPIGLIGTYWGGTPAQAWTSITALEKDPAFVNYVKGYHATVERAPAALAAYPALLAQFDADLAKWKQDVEPGYNVEIKTWDDATNQARKAGQPLPPKPQPSQPMPRKPGTPDGGSGVPTVLYNGMIAPLIPYAIKGAIWYQGESNAGSPDSAELYRTLFPVMITDWREKWGQGNFPFIFVQLTSFATGTSWPVLREAQLKTLSLPNTGMAVIIDIGEPLNIHPRDKMDVGLRLALAAKHVAYGQKLVYSGPIFDAMKVNGGSINLTFTNTGSGLMIGAPPYTSPATVPVTVGKLDGFMIAGEDKNWFPADAKIVGDTVQVSSAQVGKPVAVRYDWAAAPSGNLYNKEKLPASPFRTDDWVDPVVKPTPTPVPATK